MKKMNNKEICVKYLIQTGKFFKTHKDSINVPQNNCASCNKELDDEDICIAISREYNNSMIDKIENSTVVHMKCIIDFALTRQIISKK